MLIISLATLPHIIEFSLAIYGTAKLIDKLFPSIKESNLFQSFFN